METEKISGCNKLWGKDEQAEPGGLLGQLK